MCCAARLGARPEEPDGDIAERRRFNVDPQPFDRLIAVAPRSIRHAAQQTILEKKGS